MEIRPSGRSRLSVWNNFYNLNLAVKCTHSVEFKLKERVRKKYNKTCLQISGYFDCEYVECWWDSKTFRTINSRVRGDKSIAVTVHWVGVVKKMINQIELETDSRGGEDRSEIVVSFDQRCHCDYFYTIDNPKTLTMIQVVLFSHLTVQLPSISLSQ